MNNEFFMITKKNKEHKMDGKNRSDIKIGINVEVVQKQDQRTGNLTKGVVKRILTKSKTYNSNFRGFNTL